MMYPLPTRIFFTGFMATGKSRLGELTAAALGWRHFDTDTLVERKTECSISQLFAEEGEESFRKLELQVIKEVCHEERVVISLGGGALKNPQARALIRESGTLIGLWAKPETILERVSRKDNRPLLANLTPDEKLKKINHLLDERKDLYALADFHVESRDDVPHHVLTRKIVCRLQLESIQPLTVSLGDRSYPIYIKEDLGYHLGAISDKLDCPEQFLIVTDINLKKYHKKFLRTMSASLAKCRIFYFKPGEKEKNLTSINRLFTYLLKHQYSRKTTLLAFGGGVVGDMVGFAAAIYLRGVEFIQIPTTLLAMVDSSVGGKTGVNHRLGKNLIGAFYQPRAVVISTSILATLPEEEYLAGIAEVIKYAVIWDSDFFDFLDKNSELILQKQNEILETIIDRCCRIKAEIVHLDEREKGLRAVLNYGHTFAHAIEAVNSFHGLTHGLAVALGMITAARLAVLVNMLSPEDESKQQNLLAKFGLPRTHAMDRERAWEIMALDKKVDRGSRMYILPTGIGKVKAVSDVEKQFVLKSWDAIAPAVGPQQHDSSNAGAG
ncbi:3-dehydroquinate synthase [Fibrobacterota bacterium]